MPEMRVSLVQVVTQLLRVAQEVMPELRVSLPSPMQGEGPGVRVETNGRRALPASNL